MLLSKAELGGFGIAIVIIVVMGIIALAGPFHHINKTHAATGPMVVDKIENIKNANQPWQFAPRNFTVKVGQPVRFENLTGVDHTATQLDHSFDSGNIAQNQSWTFTPTKPGKYAYYCAYHAWMTGVITVTQ